jgi:hypothetical protein
MNEGSAGAQASAAPAAVHRLSWPASMQGAIIVTLVRPVTWAIGLAGFLAGGGILLVGLPVAVLPTPSGLQNALGGPVSTLVVGTPSAALIALIVAAVAGAVVALIAGTVLGAWAEREGVLEVLAAARDEGLAALPELPAPPSVARVAGLRLLSLVPLAIAVGLAWQPLYDASYQELILPTDLATPLPIRVIRAVPLPLALVGLTWLVSDAAAAIGVRRLIFGQRRVIVAWLLGWLELARRPIRTMGTALVGFGVLVVLLGPSMLASMAGWSRVREVLLAGGDMVGALPAVIAWIAIWLGALVLGGVAAAVRAAAWTLVTVGAS